MTIAEMEMDTDTTDTEVTRRRLIYRSKKRGNKEMDLILGPFAAAHVAGFTLEQLELYEDILEADDVDLYAWLTRQKPVPEALRNDVMDLLLNFKIVIQSID